MLFFVLLGLVSSISPDECFHRLLNYDIDKPCFNLLLSKVLGYSFICTSSILKLPQILKIYKNSSVQGISLTSFYFETLAFSILAAYAIHNGQPFSTYGENATITIQCLIQVILYWIISKKNPKHISTVSIGFIGLWFIPLFGNLMPEPFWQYVPVYCMMMNTIVKLSQIRTNYANGSTGNLSFITTFLNFYGTLSRVFTTFTELNDPLLLLSYAWGVFLNSILIFQFTVYWNVKDKQQ